MPANKGHKHSAPSPSPDELERLLEERTIELAQANGRLRAKLAEQERTVESLLLANRRLAAIFDHTFHFVGLMSAEGILLEINRTALEFAGVKREQVVGRAFWGIEWWIRSNTSSEHVRSAVERAARGRFVRFEAEFDGPRGAVIDFTLTPLRDNAGQVTQIIPEGRDVTRRRRAEGALRESEDRFRKSFDHAPIGFGLVSLDGSWTRVNESLCEITGMPETELLTTMLQATLAPDDRPRYDAAIARLVAGTRRTVEFDARFIRADSRDLWVHLSISLVRSDRGEPLYFVAHVQNIEERRRSERLMREAIEAAEQANRIKSEFVAATSHEIRTPLNAIIGMTGMLLDTRLGDQQREFTEIIRKSGESLLSIINDILDLSKVESGKLELDTQPFDLRACIEDSVELVASRAAEKQIELLWTIAPSLPTRIIGDVTRVQQVLANLLSNAVKFTDRGEITVDVRGRLRPDRMLEVTFAVRDTGIGIERSHLPRLFERFTQVDSSNTRRHGGTGLGLAISKRLVEAMGGRIWAESSPGFGSTFCFTLVTQAASDRATTRGFDNSPLEGRDILVVIDHHALRAMVVEQLEAWGTRPAVVASSDALTLVRAGARFDVALVDSAIGGGAGVAFVKQLRACTATREIPTLILSSATQVEERSSVEGLVGIAWLLKPVRQSQLFDGLMTALHGGVPAAEPGPPHQPALSSIPLSILLAEDNAVNQRVALLMLEGLGFRADVAANGIEAVEALQRQRYDVVLMDVQMPELDGLEATRNIRTTVEPTNQPWIIAMTASAIDGFEEVCLDAGMNDYVAKPVRRESLAEAIRRAVEALPPRASEAAAAAPAKPSSSATEESAAPAQDEAPAEAPTAEEESPRTASESPAIDKHVLGELRDDLAENVGGALQEVIDDYIGNAAELMGGLHSAARDGRPADFKRMAHSLKSSSAWIGAMRLAGLARELELDSSATIPDDWSERLEAVGAELDRVRGELGRSVGAEGKMESGDGRATGSIE